MITRILICIPTYDNDKTIANVVRECLQCTDLPVLVIDDGSKNAASELLEKNNKRIKVFRFPQNIGKGNALRKAFELAVEWDYTHIITIDGDGQHLPSDILKFLTAIKEDPWSLVIGKRKFSTDENVPQISRFGRNFSNFWVRYQTDSFVDDSQSGFRAYPLFFVQNISFFCNRYDFEIEVLIRLIWKGVTVKEIDVDVYYPPKHERVSHFHKFKDNIRISTLNTFLVIISLLRSRLSSKELAIGIGVGVFVGTTPLWGFHTLIVSLIAFFFRLNWPILWLGSQISIPPAVPFLIWGAAKIRMALTGEATLFQLQEFSIKHVYENFGAIIPWLFVEGILLGLILGLTIFAISLVYKNRIHQRSLNKNWSGKIRGGKVGNIFLFHLLKRGGLKTAYFVLLFIVPYFYLFAPKARKASLEFWKLIKPDRNIFVYIGMTLKQFFFLGMIMLDRVYQGFYNEKKFEIISQGENFLKNTEEGLFIMGVHAGANDMAASFMEKSCPIKVLNIVKHAPKDFSFEQIKAMQSNKSSINFIHTNNNIFPVFEIREAVARNEHVAFLIDRPPRHTCELVRFMKRLFPFDATPFKIAALSERPVSFLFTFKKDIKTYYFFMTPPRIYKYSNQLSRIEQIKLWIEDFASLLEQQIRIYPEQWLNFYSAWSSLPDASSTGTMHITETSNSREELHPHTPKILGPELASNTNA
ncbi:MAG: DUF2062 domain-containing protein [Oligoflexia bacterium]|nr:DUF2062 domain-containing protein [Oligoflexia bacterium]